ncbi:hypothetical protein ZWY2020_041564 [Hordeum vulgare]|nr:hypothetical protein ZWY2020_041564 [Hordeum vulgare]
MEFAREFQLLLSAAVPDFLPDPDAMFRDLVRLGYIIQANTDNVIPHVGVARAPDDPACALVVDEALKTVHAPSDGHDCPICMEDDDVDDDAATASPRAWRETPCGHRFHKQCVERWLRVKGSCPMCRRQVVTMPATRSPSNAGFSDLELAELGLDDALMEFMHA